MAEEGAGGCFGGSVGTAELECVERGGGGWWGVLNDLARVELDVSPLCLAALGMVAKRLWRVVEIVQ